MNDRIILCGTDSPQPGTEPYYIGYTDLVDGYRHAWFDGKKIRRGRNFGHPSDPRCPECLTRVSPPGNGESA